MNIINDAQSGDEAAFAELVKQNLPLIYRYLFRLTGSEAAAEDLAQETFVRIWKNLPRFDAKKPFRPWLFRIARNCAFDYLRKKKTVPFSYLSEREQLSLENLPDDKISPTAVTEKKETVVLVNTLLSELSDTEREILTLHYLDELTVPEIAEILKKPEETIRTRLRRAREAFREAKIENEPSSMPGSVLESNDPNI
jgi:RNA polymerase sigma-70 factor (ECF subfamily)